jgi:glycosyltransferase involved in cell wall biosynthesis
MSASPADAMGPATPAPRLSICIATFKRGAFIGETLASILPGLPAGVEVVVLDGASPDDTQAVVSAWAARHPQLRYVRGETYSGVDQDYDKAVGLARGDYCWLMTDDDLLCEGAVARVLAACADDPDLVVVNARVEDTGFERVLVPRLLAIDGDREFDRAGEGELFALAGRYLSFIGAVVIRRSLWLARAREPYFGSLFIHMGVMFQAPGIARARVLAEPLIRLRYGNSMWSPRGFDIWLRMWPELVWSFERFPAAQRARVCRRYPWQQARKVFMYRALGVYGMELYRQRFASLPAGPRLLLRAIAMVPGRLANLLASLYCLVAGGPGRMSLHDLLRSANATFATRIAARLAGA